MNNESSSPTALLRVADLTKRFGTVEALSRVSFAAKQGEILGLIGPNGAGKSTLLECITGLLPVDAGCVFWRETPLPMNERRRHVWYQPDDCLPFPRQSIGRTLSFFRQVHGAGPDTLDTLLRELDLTPVLSQSMSALSKGYRRRVLLALALLSPRPLLLLDEPFDGFDLRQSLGVMDVLRRCRGNRTMILSIHQLTEAERICDRFLLLDQGRVLGCGTLEALRRQAGISPTANLEDVFLAIT